MMRHGSTRYSLVELPLRSMTSPLPSKAARAHEQKDNFATALCWRGVVAVAVVLVVFIVIWFRVAHLQIFKRAELESFADGFQPRYGELAGQPGDLLDCYDRVMATSVQVFAIKIDPRRFREDVPVAARGKAVRLMAEALGRPESEIWATVKSSRSWEYLARRVSIETKNCLVQVLRDNDIPRVVAEPEYVREYPMGLTAASLLGWRGPDHAARCGVEQAYDFVLTGLPGSRVGNRDKYGRLVLWGAERQAVRARPGRGVVMTVDADLQQAAEIALGNLEAKHHPKACHALVIEPKTGAIRAMASRPSYDPNWFSGAVQSNRRPTKDDLDNPVVNKGFEPGSVMKIFTVAEALEEGKTEESEGFSCGGMLPNVGGRPLYCNDGRAHGSMNLTGVVCKSCNINAARLAQRIGGVAIVKALKRFGFGAPTRVGLYPEGFGLLPPSPGHDMLYERDVANLGFGQGMSCTLIQLAAAYCGVVNDGVYMLPYVVQSVVEEDWTEFRRVQPKAVRRVCSVETSRRLRQMLQAVVDEGTGRAARIPGVKVGGKTGTAQKPGPSGRYEKGKHVAVFVMVVPIDDPRWVIAVMADEPKNGYHGGQVAAPAAKEIALAALRLSGKLPVQAQVARVAGEAASAMSTGD